MLYTPQLPTLPRGAPATGPIDPPVIQRMTDGSYVAHPYSYFGIQLSAGLQQLVPAYDDAVTIEAARQQAGPGGLVRLLPAVYQTFTPVGVVFGADVAGISAQDVFVWGQGSGGTSIQGQASFAGAGLITLAAVNHAKTQAPGFRDLQLDGSLLPGTAINGIDITGPLVGTRFNGQITVVNMPNWGLQTHADNLVSSGNKSPYQFYQTGQMTFHQCGGGGLIAITATDSEWDTLVARGCGANANHGFFIQDWSNSTIKKLRAEFTTLNHGIRITGAFNTGTGSGGLQIGQISTDRNNGHGILIDATGNSPIEIGQIMCRRDGRQGGAGGGAFAGLAVVGAGVPVTIGAMTNFPGVDDNGTGTNSPDYGLKLVATNTLVALANALLQAQLAGINGTSGASYRNVWTATGTTSAPSAWALTADTA